MTHAEPLLRECTRTLLWNGAATVLFFACLFAVYALTWRVTIDANPPEPIAVFIPMSEIVKDDEFRGSFVEYAERPRFVEVRL